jgi:SAM-dependent methyltransferase
MRDLVVDYLACPDCGSDLELKVVDRDGDEIMNGELACAGCPAVYAIVGGVPRMNVAMDKLERVAETFSYEWKAHHRGELEDETLFGRTLEEDWARFLRDMAIDEDRVQGAVVLDGGCGSGRPTRQIGEHGAKVVIGVDINEAVDEAFAFCRDLPNVHIVQGNIFALPLKPQVFDLVWSNGVIHHTPDARRAHRSLAKHVKPGGVLYVWVYAKRFNPFRLTKDILDVLRVTRLPQRTLFRVSKAFAYISMPLLWAYQGARKLPGLRPRTAWGRGTVRRRTLRELQLTWFDGIAPEYVTRHTDSEVIEWFERLGFEEIIVVDEPKVGVRGVASTTSAHAATA